MDPQDPLGVLAHLELEDHLVLLDLEDPMASQDHPDLKEPLDYQALMVVLV